LPERAIVERLIDRCDPAEVLVALRTLERWGLLHRFERDGLPYVRWRDQFVAAIAPKVLALLDDRVDGIARLRIDRDCPVHVVVALPKECRLGDNAVDLHPLSLLAAGRGTSLGAAVLGGLAEAAEIISATYRGDEATVRAPFAQLGERAVPPGDLLLFSDNQYRRRNWWNISHGDRNEVPLPVDAATAIDWAHARAIHDGTVWRIPTAYCYLRYRWKTGDIRFCQADTNGCAVGATRDHAILKALLELIERDAVAIWWYNRLRRPAVDLSALRDDGVLTMRDWLETVGRSLHVLDLSGDLPVCVVAAVSADLKGRRIALGFSSHFEPSQAVLAAVMEMHQFLVQATMIERFDSEGKKLNLSSDIADLMKWWSGQTLAHHPYLIPAETGAQPMRQRSDHVEPEAGITRLVEEMMRRSMIPLALDTTRGDLDVPAVRVVVPGLRSWWARFAPGRLYQVPMTLGWLDHPLAEDEMNPLPMFI
jgi:ribosomal protein S12 methylthiotransferase accessory factor